MGKVIAGMVMSLDGFVSDKDGGVHHLYPDMEAMRESIQEAIRTTGAVIMGRHTFEMEGDPDAYADSYEFQVPIFVVTHHPPANHPAENDKLTFTFVEGELGAIVRQAKQAAGDKNVVIVGGATLIRQCIEARLIDELQIDIRHILLGGGLRLFDQMQNTPMELGITSVRESNYGVTHLVYSFTT